MSQLSNILFTLSTITEEGLVRTLFTFLLHFLNETYVFVNQYTGPFTWGGASIFVVLALVRAVSGVVKLILYILLVLCIIFLIFTFLG